ncbi:MAG: DUF459 domain-containing protein [Deltaproteobacteria bacterium]|nr:DUF459 domain-containing protein [Deltaproteobacteria bacterium]
MSARAPRWLSLAALSLCFSACKPEAPVESAAEGNPEEGPIAAEPSPAAEDPIAPDSEAPGEPAGQGATLAATNPSAPDPDALDPQPEPAIEEPEISPEEPAVPEEPRRVLILGDSLAATGFGALLERKLDANPNVVCYRKGKSSSGLARPDFFDWKAEAKRQVEYRKPDLVIVIMGGNDGQDLTRRKSSRGRRVPWKHENWATAYRERVDSFLSQVQAPDRKVLWLGLPHMGLRSLEKKLTIIRDVQQNAVEALGDDGIYLDTIPFVTTDDGKMLKQAKVGARNKLQTLRADDKIHFTMAGSEYLAALVYPEVLEALGVPDVQAE